LYHGFVIRELGTEFVCPASATGTNLISSLILSNFG